MRSVTSETLALTLASIVIQASCLQNEHRLCAPPWSWAVLHPCSAVAFDQRDGGGGAPAAGNIGARDFIYLAPRLTDRVNPAPCRFDFVPAHEQGRVSADHIHQQPFVSVRYRDVECFRKAHVEGDILQPHAAGSGLLDQEPELDSLVGLQADHEPRLHRLSRFRVEDRMWN